MVCRDAPADPGPGVDVLGALTDFSVSYGMNLFLSGQSLAAINKPADTVAFSDVLIAGGTTGYHLGAPGAFVASGSNTIGSPKPAVPHYRHNGQCNVGFADGHVKSMVGVNANGTPMTIDRTVASRTSMFCLA